MGHRFYTDEMTVGWFLSTVVVVALLFRTSTTLRPSTNTP